MRSNLDGEYYVKYKESSQHMVPLAKFLQEYGITAQYTMSDRLEQNGVAKIRNCTLKYMVRSLTNLNLYHPGERINSSCMTKIFILK